MRTSTYIFFSLIVFGVALFAGIPHVSHASPVFDPSKIRSPLTFTGLSWTNPKTYIATDMKDGGTYSVPFNVSGDTQIGALNTTYAFGEVGNLYHISATSSTRTFIADFSGTWASQFSWRQYGEYELKVYQYPPPTLSEASWWRRSLAFLIGNTAYAAYGDPILIATIHFTVKNASDTCTTHNSCTDNILFVPGIEGSRLYYRGLANIEHQVWEPDFYTDIPYLAMNADGTSKYNLYTKDIIGSLYGNNPIEQAVAKLRLGANGVQVYGKFETFMNGLVASSTIKEWRSYPYDWRYDVRDIVNNGTLTEMPNGNIKRMYIEKVLERLASTSPTGKVTIIAHSNGGLVAKALMQKLSIDEKSNLVDKLIMIATPQWGTPSDIGVMLHGDGQTQGLGLIMDGKDVRTVIRTMPDAYDLLPSQAYFAHVASPVVTFDTNGSLTKKLSGAYGATITSFQKLADFLENSAELNMYFNPNNTSILSFIDKTSSDTTNDLYSPMILSSSLINKAVATHSVLDEWTPHPAIAVTAIAGWGQDTVKTLAYTTKQKVVCTNTLSASVFSAFKPCSTVSYLEHTPPVTTQDGDGTVVSPSAVGVTTDSLYFNAARFRNDRNGNYIHKNLMAAAPIQKTIRALLTNSSSTTEQYITTNKPTNGANPIKLRISSHSPVNIIVTSANGKQSGVLPIPGTDFSGIKRDIIGSSVQVFDTEEYINVPKSGSYHVSASGYANGSATLRIETIASNGSASTTETFANIPTTASSTITFSLVNGKSTAPIIDLTGTGKNTFTMSTSTDPLAYVRYMKVATEAMHLSRSEHFILKARLSAIETQLAGENRMERVIKNMHGRMRGGYQRFSHWRNQSIKFELNMLERYVEQQFALSSRLSKYKHMYHHRWHSAQPHITKLQTETIFDMINRLKTLL